MFALELAEFLRSLFIIQMNGTVVSFVESQDLVVLQHFQGCVARIELNEISAGLHARFDVRSVVRQGMKIDRATHTIETVETIGVLIA